MARVQQTVESLQGRAYRIEIAIIYVWIALAVTGITVGVGDQCVLCGRGVLFDDIRRRQVIEQHRLRIIHH